MNQQIIIKDKHHHHQQQQTNENPAPSEPSAVPKNSDEPSNNTDINQGISSLLNMFRAAGGTASTIIPPPTATVETDSQKSEKAVEECVEKMKAMGFADPNNDLLELIRSKNGDLNSVLDEMTRYHQP